MSRTFASGGRSQHGQSTTLRWARPSWASTKPCGGYMSVYHTPRPCLRLISTPKRITPTNFSCPRAWSSNGSAGGLLTHDHPHNVAFATIVRHSPVAALQLGCFCASTYLRGCGSKQGSKLCLSCSPRGRRARVHRSGHESHLLERGSNDDCEVVVSLQLLNQHGVHALTVRGRVGHSHGLHIVSCGKPAQ